MQFLILCVIIGGPILSWVALFLSFFPKLRPKRLRRTLTCLSLLLSLPVALSLLAQSGYPLLILRPGTTVLAACGGISYLVLCIRSKLPWGTAIPAILLLAASALDAVSLYLMNDPGFGGGYCSLSSQLD